VARVNAPSEPIDPMIANADAGRGQGVVTRESLIGARVVVAPLEDHIAIGIEDFAPRSGLRDP
jgi:hypothetical protein